MSKIRKKKRKKKRKIKKDLTPEEKYEKSASFLKCGQLEKALSMIVSAINQKPEEARFLELRAEIQLKIGNITESISDYLKVIELRPSKINIYKQLGLLHIQIEKYTLAKEYLIKGKEILKSEYDDIEENEGEDDINDEEEEEGESDDDEEEGEDSGLDEEDEKLLNELEELISLCEGIFSTEQDFQLNRYKQLKTLSSNIHMQLTKLFDFSEKVVKSITKELEKTSLMKGKKCVVKKNIKKKRNLRSSLVKILDDGKFENVRFFTKNKLETLLNVLDQKLRIFLFGRTKSGKSSLLNLFLGTDKLPVSANPCTSALITLRYTNEEEKVKIRIRVKPKTMSLSECKDVKVCTYAFSGPRNEVHEDIKFFECTKCLLNVCQFCAERCHCDHKDKLRELSVDNKDEYTNGKIFCDCYEFNIPDKQCCEFEKGSHEMKEISLNEGDDSWEKFVNKNRNVESGVLVENAEMFLNIDILKFVEFVDVPGFGEGRKDLDDLVNRSLFSQPNDAAIFVFHGEEPIGKEWKDFCDQNREKLKKYSSRILIVGTRLDNIYSQIESREDRVKRQFREYIFGEKSTRDFGLFFVENRMEEKKHSLEFRTLLEYRQRFASLKKQINQFAIESSFDMCHHVLLSFEEEACGLKSFFTKIRDISNMKVDERKHFVTGEEKKQKILTTQITAQRKRYKDDMKFWNDVAMKHIQHFWKNSETSKKIEEVVKPLYKVGNEFVDTSWNRWAQENRYLMVMGGIHRFFLNTFVKSFMNKHRKEMSSNISEEVENVVFNNIGEDVHVYDSNFILHSGGAMIDSMVKNMKKYETKEDRSSGHSYVIGDICKVSFDVGAVATIAVPAALAGMFIEVTTDALFRKKSTPAQRFTSLFVKNRVKSKALRQQSKELLSTLDNTWKNLIERQVNLLEMKKWFCQFLKIQQASNFSVTFEPLLKECDDILDLFYSFSVLPFLQNRFSIGNNGNDDDDEIKKIEIIYRNDPFVTVEKVSLKSVSNRLFCLKKVSIDHDSLVSIVREAFLSASMYHPNCLSLEGFGLSDSNHGLILTRFYDGSLLDLLVKYDSSVFGIRERVFCIDGLLNGILYLHNKRIIHRDLKPGNVLVSYSLNNSRTILSIDELVVCDFGTSKMSDDMTCTVVGTPSYTAPEILSSNIKQEYQITRKKDIRVHTAAVDIYSLGIVIFEILSGIKASVDNIFGVYRPELTQISCWSGEEIGKKTFELIDSCLSLEAKDRPTIIKLKKSWDEDIKQELLCCHEEFPKFVRRMHVQRK